VILLLAWKAACRRLPTLGQNGMSESLLQFSIMNCCYLVFI
jgi:hypothetical protein